MKIEKKNNPDFAVQLARAVGEAILTGKPMMVWHLGDAITVEPTKMHRTTPTFRFEGDNFLILSMNVTAFDAQDVSTGDLISRIEAIEARLEGMMRHSG